MSDMDPFVREAVQAKIQKDIEDKVYEKIKGELSRNIPRIDIFIYCREWRRILPKVDSKCYR